MGRKNKKIIKNEHRKGLIFENKENLSELRGVLPRLRN